MTKETILLEAQRLTTNDRQGDYGHPAQDFTRTGRLWAAILDVPHISAQQVALCMVAVKMSRELYKPKRDNRVDMAGYVNCLDMVEEFKKIPRWPPAPSSGVAIGVPSRHVVSTDGPGVGGWPQAPKSGVALGVASQGVRLDPVSGNVSINMPADAADDTH